VAIRVAISSRTFLLVAVIGFPFPAVRTQRGPRPHPKADSSLRCTALGMTVILSAAKDLLFFALRRSWPLVIHRTQRGRATTKACIFNTKTPGHQGGAKPKELAQVAHRIALPFCCRCGSVLALGFLVSWCLGVESCLEESSHPRRFSG